MMANYFVSYAYEEGFGYSHISMKGRLHNTNMNEVQRYLEKEANAKSVSIIYYKRIWFPKRVKPIVDKEESNE